MSEPTRNADVAPLFVTPEWLTVSTPQMWWWWMAAGICRAQARARADFSAAHIPGALFRHRRDCRPPSHGADAAKWVYSSDDQEARHRQRRPLWWPMTRAGSNSSAGVVDVQGLRRQGIDVTGRTALDQRSSGRIRSATAIGAGFVPGTQRPELICDADDVLAISTQRAQVIDARTPGRFAGTQDNPFGVRSGRIPSKNVYWAGSSIRDQHVVASLRARLASVSRNRALIPASRLSCRAVGG